MPKVLAEAQVQAFERDGCLSPVRAMSAGRARHYGERFEDIEARVPDIKKMKTKSHLLWPSVLEIAEDPHILDIFEDLIGSNIRCWSMAWRVPTARPSPAATRIPPMERRSWWCSAGWPCRSAGCRRVASTASPARTGWGILRHEENDDLRSTLSSRLLTKT